MIKLCKDRLKMRRFFSVIIVFALMIALSSCTNKNQNGTLDRDGTYASIGNYSVTNGEVWDELKWNLTDSLEEQIKQLIIKDYYDKVKTTMDGGESELKTEYTNRLIQICAKNVYSLNESDDYLEEIDDLSEQLKKQVVKKYVDQMYLNENVSLDANDLLDCKFTNIYSYYYETLAEELFAMNYLEDKIKEAEDDIDEDDEDSVGYFTKSQITQKYKDEYRNTGDVNVVAIRFIDDDEVKTTLKAFGIKTYKNDWYYVQQPSDSEKTYSDYYDDFEFTSNNTNNYVKLDTLGESIILQLYIEMYNYIYTYREQLSDMGQVFGDQSTNDRRSVTEALMNYRNTAIPTIDEVFEYINGNEYTKYTAKELKNIDSSLKTYVYDTLKIDDEDTKRYSTSGRSYNSFYWLIFKVSQQEDTYKDIYNDDITTDDLYDKIKENTELYDKIIADLKDEQITDTYITNMFNEVRKDVKLTIYDKALEITYAAKNENYSKNHKKAPNKNTLAVIKYDGKKAYYTLMKDDNSTYSAWEEQTLENGSTTAIDLLSRKIIKDNELYKTSFTKEDIETYEKSIEYLLASFANDNLSSNGYPSRIGKYNFLMIYFHTANINDIIENYYKIQAVSSKILNNYSDQKLLEFLESYSKLAYDKYFEIGGTRLLVYIDMDEDNTPDDKSEWSSTQVQGAKELLEDISNYILSSSDTHANAIKSIVDEYKSSSRFDNGKTDPSNPQYDPTEPESKWAKYRRLGLYIKTEDISYTNTTSSDDTSVKDRMKQIYKMSGYQIGDSFPSQYLDIESVDEWTWTTKDNTDKTGTKFTLSDDGLNLLLATSAKVPSSAKFTTDDDIEGLYKNIYVYLNDEKITIDNVYNENDSLNLNQIKLYTYEMVTNGTSTLSPSNLTSALTSFYSPVLTKYRSEATQREVLVQFMNKSTGQEISFTNNVENDRFDKILLINRNIADNYEDQNSDANNFTGWWDNLFQLIGKGE